MNEEKKLKSVPTSLKLAVKKRIRKKTKKPETAPPAVKKLKLLITIVNRQKAEFYMDLLQGFEVNMQICMLAEGTADSEMRQVLGLADSERVVLWSIIREDKAAKAMQKLEEKFQSVKNGKGIAYTVPLTGVIGVAIYQFLSNNRMIRENK